MIVQIEKEATLLNKKADALVLVVDHDGADRTGLLKHWLDIGQVIAMMATCKELTPGTALHFELERAHLYVVTSEDFEASMKRVLAMAGSHDVSSINVPDIEGLAHVIWGMSEDDDIVINLCSK